MTYSELSILLMGIDEYELVFAYLEKWDIKQPYFDEKRIIVARCNHFEEVVQYLLYVSRSN